MKPTLTRAVFQEKENNKQVHDNFNTIFLLHPSTASREQILTPPMGLRRSKSRVGERLKKIQTLVD
jgi:hypothetical protein